MPELLRRPDPTARFALLYPDVTERLVLYNQIGLTDARLQRPPTPIDQVYKQLLNQSYDAVYRGIARYVRDGWAAWRSGLPSLAAS